MVGGARREHVNTRSDWLLPPRHGEASQWRASRRPPASNHRAERRLGDPAEPIRALLLLLLLGGRRACWVTARGRRQAGIKTYKKKVGDVPGYIIAAQSRRDVPVSVSRTDTCLAT